MIEMAISFGPELGHDPIVLTCLDEALIIEQGSVCADLNDESRDTLIDALANVFELVRNEIVTLSSAPDCMPEGDL